MLDPIGFTNIIIIACGIYCLVVGVVSAVKYFRMDAEDTGIDRTTFYSHYNSQYDELKDMENTMLQDVKTIIDQF